MMRWREDGDSYPCLGAPNHEGAVHDRVLALQDECPFLH
jgi:hypothetical protein